MLSSVPVLMSNCLEAASHCVLKGRETSNYLTYSSFSIWVFLMSQMALSSKVVSLTPTGVTRSCRHVCIGVSWGSAKN